MKQTQLNRDASVWPTYTNKTIGEDLLDSIMLFHILATGLDCENQNNFSWWSAGDEFQREAALSYSSAEADANNVYNPFGGCSLV